MTYFDTCDYIEIEVYTKKEKIENELILIRFSMIQIYNKTRSWLNMHQVQLQLFNYETLICFCC